MQAQRRKACPEPIKVFGRLPIILFVFVWTDAEPPLEKTHNFHEDRKKDFGRFAA